MALPINPKSKPVFCEDKAKCLVPLVTPIVCKKMNEISHLMNYDIISLGVITILTKYWLFLLCLPNIIWLLLLSIISQKTSIAAGT